jgi:hypothetical protein
MGDKYKIKKTDLKAFFASAEMAMDNNYHALFKKMGLKQGSNNNFYCINEIAHGGGKDANPSMSIDNSNGQWKCHTCGITGNFQSYWKEYEKGTQSGDSYTDFVVDLIGTNILGNFSETRKDKDFERNSRELKKLHQILSTEKFRENGKPFILGGNLTGAIRDMSILPMKDLDIWVDQLLANEKAMDYLYKTRRIDEKVIRKYRLGWFEHKGVSKTGRPFSNWKYVFPVINAEGDLINVKAYDPTTSDPAFKWMYPFKGYENGPIPINNFTQQKLYFFEGEPDLYCAIAFGFEGAVTIGSQSMHDINNVFGKDHAKQMFTGKEIVICFDAETDAVTKTKEYANELAVSLYPYVKQIKILDLNRSEMNPKGLDPELMKEVTSKGVTKLKRVQTDFTDFMQLNGFNESAKNEFLALIERTEVFTHNVERARKEVFKVTLQEASNPKYFSPDRTKELQVVASVADFNCNAYMYPTKFTVSCPAMGKDTDSIMRGKKYPSCKHCILPTMDGFDTSKSMTFEFSRGVSEDDRTIEINDHNILGLIEVSNSQKIKHIKRMASITENCSWCMIDDSVPEKLLHVRLSKDINEYIESGIESSGESSSSDVDMEAYILGYSDIHPNKTYRFTATQTTAWLGQSAVLFISKTEPIETSIESFKMDQDTHDLLSIFKPKEGESIKDSLERRYDIFAKAAGITGRKELFFINDLAYFSAVEINSKLLPSVPRGWVEVLIAGDPRTCKTMVSKFLNKHYKVGTIVAGSSAVSRSGLIGGTSFFNKKAQISWGRMPMNDKGMVIIDEMSEISVDALTDLTYLRSEGVAIIDQIISSQAMARVRKIMLSNPRGWKEEEQKEYNYGIQFLKDLFMKDRILARFDIGFVVRKGDIDINEFDSAYEEITTEFNEYQCRHLIMWCYSRKPEDIVFEDGFDERTNEIQKEMLKKYHSSTQLINQEMRAKLMRLSVSLATILYSTVKDDWNKIYVKLEHVDHVAKFLDEIYCHKNLKMDNFSKMKYDSEKLGSMEFMKNICEYIDIAPLFQEEEFSEKGIQQIFYDYLHRVSKGKLFIIDAKSDKATSFGMMVHEANQKLIGILTARNCLTRSKRGVYKKTIMFNTWLAERSRRGDKADKSDILELEKNKLDNSLIEKIKEIDLNNGGSEERKSG